MRHPLVREQAMHVTQLHVHAYAVCGRTGSALALIPKSSPAACLLQRKKKTNTVLTHMWKRHLADACMQAHTHVYESKYTPVR